MKLFSKSSLIMVVALSILLQFTFASVGVASSAQLDYVSLGDSLAAGMTPNYTIDMSYTDLIAQKLEGEGVLGDYKNFGVPGYTTVDVLNSMNPTSAQYTERMLAIKQAEIITLDIGANDLLGIMPYLLQNQTSAPLAIQGVVSNVAQIVYTLKGINPNAKIYLMGYYNAFPYYPNEIQQNLISIIKGFNLALEDVANLTNATYVDTYDIMDQHLAKYLPEDNIHPNIFGYRAIAKEFWNIIKVDFLREV